MNTLDAFTRAYCMAALFTEDPNPGQGEYQEHGEWTIANIATDSLTVIQKDCASFQTQAGELIADDLEHAGRDFWYTRNGHGCGFWDGDWPELVGEQLTVLAESYGEMYLYRGDDGRLYV
jgi:hypothetical protein